MAHEGVEPWPELPLDEWRDTRETLHLWMQIAGKVRLARSPWINHSWHATLYPTASGLTTSLIPDAGGGFEIDFDFVAHRLIVRSSRGLTSSFALEPQTVAAFHRQITEALAAIDVRVPIHMTPNEVEVAIRFDQDEQHRAYDPEYAARFWRVLVRSSHVFTEFRARFIGKCSPVHIFWGAPDLALTRFSGRPAPEHPGGVPHLPDRVAREAYSHEVSSCGFWPGGGPVPTAVFYAYAYPEPEGYAQARVSPGEAYYHADLREFVLPYEAVRQSADPEATLLAFLQSTYEAAADLGKWDRASLERDEAELRRFRP